jgi:hypothetical protein
MKISCQGIYFAIENKQDGVFTRMNTGDNRCPEKVG